MAVTDPGSPLHGLTADQIFVDDGYLRAGNRSESLADLLARSATEGIEASASAAPDEAPPYSSYGFGAVFAEVRVDPDLGEVRVARLTAAYAAGRILNPLLSRSQFIGGLIWGIGMALHETTVMDERLGRIVNDSLADYLIPVHADMPEFDIIWSKRTSRTSAAAASRELACSGQWAQQPRSPTRSFMRRPADPRPADADRATRRCRLIDLEFDETLSLHQVRFERAEPSGIVLRS